MADLPVRLEGDLAAQLLRSLDVEGKIPRALDALGPLRGRDVVLVGADGGYRARQLAELGGRLTVVAEDPARDAVAAALADLEPAPRVVGGSAGALELPDASTDVVVTCWSSFLGPSPGQVAEADRVLRPDGRLLVLHDYGRDDVSLLWPDAQEAHLAWSRRDGWFLQSGFKIRVIHCWWTFETSEATAAFLTGIAGERGSRVAAGLKRPRLSYNVAIYHRGRGEGGATEGASTSVLRA